MKTLIKFLLVSILIGISTFCHAKKYKYEFEGIIEELQYYNFQVEIKYSTNVREYFEDIEDIENGNGLLLSDEINSIISEVLAEMKSIYTLQDWTINYPNVYTDFECRICEKVTDELPNVEFRMTKIRFYWGCNPNNY